MVRVWSGPTLPLRAVTSNDATSVDAQMVTMMMMMMLLLLGLLLLLLLLSPAVLASAPASVRVRTLR